MIVGQKDDSLAKKMIVGEKMIVGQQDDSVAKKIIMG
jgi:hypothetical protein